MTTLHIINANSGETSTEWWSKAIHHDGSFGIASGQYPVIASIDVDDRFVSDEDRRQWAAALILSWCRLAGCAHRGVYAGIIGDETVAAVVSGMIQEPWIVVRGDDDNASLCEGGGDGAPVLWYQTEGEALAAAAQYRERLLEIARDEGTPVERATRAVDSLNIRIVQAGDGWKWVTEQTFFSSPRRRCRIIDGLAEPIY